MKHLVVVGRVERVEFPDSSVADVPAKVDTGAFRSSISSSNVHERDGSLYFTLFTPKSRWYTGKELSTDEYSYIEVENSFGHKEHRYSLYLTVKVANRKVRANFTLSNRGEKTYPVLLGRRLLKNRFIVDVSRGDPIDDEETDSPGGLL